MAGSSFAGAYFIFFVVLFIIGFAIFVVLSRWVFRVNHIVERLDSIITLLEGKPEKPKTFIEGVKMGMESK